MSTYSESYWRNHAAPIIAKVIAANADPAKLTGELRDAYPFGPRKYHPYKIWLDEIARQMGRKPKLGSRVNVYGKVVGSTQEKDERQEELFG